jgi:hypothetical protein
MTDAFEEVKRITIDNSRYLRTYDPEYFRRIRTLVPESVNDNINGITNFGTSRIDQMPCDEYLQKMLVFHEVCSTTRMMLEVKKSELSS